MRIAVINETSAADKNQDIIRTLTESDRKNEHQILNCGMKSKGRLPELQYIHTGFMAALLLNTNSADFIVGGCGTGQGFLNSVMQYPGVFCGLIRDSLDGWLFTQINGGNCISLALNQGYGWAGDVNLTFIFERIFSVEAGCGYPEARQIPQQESRKKLQNLSGITHVSFPEIINRIPQDIVQTVLRYPGIAEVLNIDKIVDNKLRESLKAAL
ncbi:MAG: RpiB/LacA/LacB family sugar-phosphate isomerase [Bacteroidetes bacterium]|nr:RpiB/LacA/LacB family sugar-phosphate isomerase [Bacteroidota bacterium]